jgi:molecular chaperone IbpA
MRSYDFSPLWRSTIGFDRLFDLAESAQRATEDNYPPYNIERLGEDSYQISLAVAGFSPDEISITAEQNVVTIEGNKPEKAEREFLYRGISTRHFKRQFNLADYVQVKNASFDNGLLKIELVREIPEAMKPQSPSTAATSISSKPRRLERIPCGGLASLCRVAAHTRLRMEEHMRPTTATHDNVFDFQALLHPGTVFEHPKDVVSHPELTLAEKRAILASWASDASAIASCPALRAPEGLKSPVSIDAILEALCELDGGPRNPPGGTPKRRFSTARELAA